MAITQIEGSSTIGTTEFSIVSGSTTLATTTSDAIVQFFLEVTNISAGDDFSFVVKEKVTTSSLQRVVYSARFDGSQGSVFVTPSLVLMNGWDATIKKTAGTDRNIGYSVRQVA